MAIRLTQTSHPVLISNSCCGLCVDLWRIIAVDMPVMGILRGTYNLGRQAHAQAHTNTHMYRVGQDRIYTPYIHRIYMVLANPTHVYMHTHTFTHSHLHHPLSHKHMSTCAHTLTSSTLTQTHEHMRIHTHSLTLSTLPCRPELMLQAALRWGTQWDGEGFVWPWDVPNLMGLSAAFILRDYVVSQQLEGGRMVGCTSLTLWGARDRGVLGDKKMEV